MEFRRGVKTGGQYNLSYLYSYLKEKFPGRIYERREIGSENIAGPFKHAIYNYREVKRLLPKVIIISIYSSCRAVFAVWLAKKLNIKIVLVHHGIRIDFRYNNIFGRFIAYCCNRYLIRNANIIQVSSKYLYNEAVKKGGGKAVIYIASPGVQVEPGSEIAVEPQKIDDRRPLKLLFIGECRIVKGLIILVRALCLLKDINIHLDVVGKYNENELYYRDIMEIIGKNGLEKRVEFHGSLDPKDMKAIFEQASIFVMPSIAEGYGIALREALIFGLPVVASNVGGIAEAVEDGINGILVEPGNSEELAAGIRRLAADAGLRRLYRKNNLEKGRNVFRWKDYYEVLDKELLPLITGYLEPASLQTKDHQKE